MQKSIIFPFKLSEIESTLLVITMLFSCLTRFGCSKLILVGDPKQLDPTIQGSDVTHSSGLEQTLFDRLMKMVNKTAQLNLQLIYFIYWLNLYKIL